jgi:hypothetical protein
VVAATDAAGEEGGTMSVQTKEAPALRHRLVPVQRWLMLAVAAVLVAGMAISAYRVVRSSSDAAPTSQGTSAAASLSEIYGSRSVTGTGPGLIRVAEESQTAALPAVTGTGPGLIWVASSRQG